MIPFKVFDREEKVTWVILNHHPGPNGGEYLAAREDDSSLDGELRCIPSTDISGYRLVGFVEEQE